MRIALLCALLFVAPLAFAQDDVLIIPIGGVYTLHVAWPPEPDVAEICCLRIDTPPEEIVGCDSTHSPFVDRDGINHPDTATVTAVIAPTLNNDALVVCRASDTSGNVSANSPNAGIIDFTPPSAPSVVSADQGDVDGDGFVDLLDVTILRRAIAGLF